MNSMLANGLIGRGCSAALHFFFFFLAVMISTIRDLHHALPHHPAGTLRLEGRNRDWKVRLISIIDWKGRVLG